MVALVENYAYQDTKTTVTKWYGLSTQLITEEMREKLDTFPKEVSPSIGVDPQNLRSQYRPTSIHPTQDH